MDLLQCHYQVIIKLRSILGVYCILGTYCSRGVYGHCSNPKAWKKCVSQSFHQSCKLRVIPTIQSWFFFYIFFKKLDWNGQIPPVFNISLPFLGSSSKPSSDLLDLQPDFAAAGQAAPAAPAGATSWGGSETSLSASLLAASVVLPGWTGTWLFLC